MARPIEPGLQALVERLLAERRRDGRLADQREVDRQRADLQHLGQVLRLLRRDTRDLGAGAAVDARRVVDEVDDRLARPARRRGRSRTSRRTARRRRSRCRRRAAGGCEALVRAALGDLRGDLGERLAAVVGEVEVDRRLVELVGARLRVGDLVAGESAACPGGRSTATGASDSSTSSVAGSSSGADSSTTVPRGTASTFVSSGCSLVREVDEQVLRAPPRARRSAGACSRRRGSSVSPLAVQPCCLHCSSETSGCSAAASTASISRLYGRSSGSGMSGFGGMTLGSKS